MPIALAPQMCYTSPVLGKEVLRIAIGVIGAEIKKGIAEALGISSEQVSVKATTNEGLGFIGRGEGIAAHATALLRR